MNRTEILKRYTRLGLLLPVLLPAVIYTIGYLAQSTGAQWPNQLPSWLLVVFAILMGSLIFGAIPYLLYYLYAWRFSRQHNYKQIYIFLLLSPLAFYLLQFSGLIIYEILE